MLNDEEFSADQKPDTSGNKKLPKSPRSPKGGRDFQRAPRAKGPARPRQKSNRNQRVRKGLEIAEQEVLF